MSDTPETDAEKFFSDHHGYCVVFAEHAEDLERERDKYQEQADALLIRLGATQERMIDAERERDILKKHISIMDALHKTANDEYFKLAVENENLEQERDAFEKELFYVRDALLDSMPHAYGSTKKLAELLVAERDEAVRACEIWQYGVGKIVEDRDYWRAEAERWRDCHHEIIADRDWLILELVEISSTADNCEDTWDALAKIGVIADNILNGREVQK